MSEWEEYTGSDEQIAEMKCATNGILVRLNTPTGKEKERTLKHWGGLEEYSDLVTHYFICSPHPLADMICQQARTGQPVWVKMKSSTYWLIAMRGFDLISQDHLCSVIKSTTPDWNIPNAEYSFSSFEKDHSFTPFEEEV